MGKPGVHPWDMHPRPPRLAPHISFWVAEDVEREEPGRSGAGKAEGRQCHPRVRKD